MSDDGKNTVLVPSQQEVKVYQNHDGDIVFKRPLDEWEIVSSEQDKEAVVYIPLPYVPQLIERLKQLLAESI